MYKLTDAAKFLAALKTLKAAGWISRYELSDPIVVDWTPHGRLRARQLVAIADELDAGGRDWVWFEAACRLLPGDEGIQLAE